MNQDEISVRTLNIISIKHLWVKKNYKQAYMAAKMGFSAELLLQDGSKTVAINIKDVVRNCRCIGCV